MLFTSGLVLNSPCSASWIVAYAEFITIHIRSRPCPLPASSKPYQPTRISPPDNTAGSPQCRCSMRSVWESLDPFVRAQFSKVSQAILSCFNQDSSRRVQSPTIQSSSDSTEKVNTNSPQPRWSSAPEGIPLIGTVIPVSRRRN